MLALVVGSAILGGRQVVGPAPAASPPVSAAASAEPPTAVPFRPAVATLDPNQPRSLIVRGWVARTSKAGGVMVTSDLGSTIAVAPMDPTGKPRNGMVPFETAFELPRSSFDPGEQLFIVITDVGGAPLAGRQRQIVQGAVVELVVR